MSGNHLSGIFYKTSVNSVDDLVHIKSSDSDEDYEPPHSQTQGSTFDSQSTNFTSNYWSGETQ
jgi:hypothetical protein